MGGGLVTYVTEAIVPLIAGAAVFAYWVANRRRIAAETVGKAEEQASRVLREAEREVETRRKEALLEAKERAHELRLEAEQYARDHRQQIAGMEQIITKRELALAEQLAAAERAEAEARARHAALNERDKSSEAAARRYEELVARQQRELERVSGLTTDEARELLMKQIEADARRESANLVKRLESEAREQAQSQARSIITQAIQRCAAEHANETTVSVVDLPSDDMKGRIIGREGRNIRALELATGVDLIVDDTPGAIILSAFDPFRREVARRVIERLIADGRIHPARIEEVVEKVKTEMEETIRKDGEAAAFELGMHDLHPEILKMMGRLQFRTSYGQNVLNHSREVAFLAGVMARELGLDSNVAVRAAFLHDIGKGVDRELQGTHLELGLDFLKKHGEIRARPAGRRRPSHGHRLAVPRSDDRAVGRRDLRVEAWRAPRHPRVVREASREARGDRRFVQGRVEVIRAAGRTRDPHHGRERAHQRRRSHLALEGHRAAHRERARVSRSDQGDGDPGNAGRRVRQMTGALVGDSSERTLIARIRARLGASPDWLQLGPGDDAAVVAPPRNLSEVITTDVLVEGVHFDRRFVPPDAIGHRALAVNLSDLAAMGAAPRLATLSLVLPPALPLADFDGIIDGIVALAEREQTTIVGGNLSRSPGPLVVDVTAIGTVHRRKVLTRGGARPGDLVFVSGAIGAGRAGLEQCRSAPDAAPDTAPTRWYLRPQPRTRLGRELGRGQVASACMDLSDGLADALEQVAEASGVRIEIDRLLPVEPDAARWFEAHGTESVNGCAGRRRRL